MALDAIVLSGLKRELEAKIVGARIDKVQQPERECVVLTLRAQGENLRLLINAGAGSGRVNLTNESIENPPEPPMFCMLLRKRLSGARVEAVTQPEYERVLVLTLLSRNEMGDELELKLVIELMGRSSNLVLVGADGRIIDCLRRMDYGGDAQRRMLPGMIYRLPPEQKKPNIFRLTPQERLEIIRAADDGRAHDKLLMDSFSGLSPLICRELACRADGSLQKLADAVEELIERVKSSDLTPTLIMADDKVQDYSFMPLMQYGTLMKLKTFDSFSELLDAFYSKRERAQRRKKRARELSHSIKSARDRISRKLVSRREEFERTNERESIRKNAELLTANMYRVKKGDRLLTAEDYYSEGCPLVEIELDPLKTPQQNAAAMFKEYTKLKTAREHLTVFIAEDERQLEYLDSVLDEMERAETEADLSEIRRELTETGYIKKQRTGKPEKVKSRGYLSFMSDDDFEILVGRNNRQNDELTTKQARRTDIWLHTKSVHGSHVIISCDGLTPPQRTIEQAASLAVYYSQAREGGKTAVDYTMVRFVKKPSGAMPGKVIYTDYNTLMAQADEELCERLRKDQSR